MTIRRLWPRSTGNPVIPSMQLSVVPRTIHVVRLVQWVMSAIMVIACGLSGWWWWESRTLEEEAARYAAAATRTEELNRQLTAQLRRDQLTLSPQEMAAIQHDVTFLNQLADKRTFSWTQLLSDLEEALPSGTSIGKIQVDMKDSTVTVDGLAARMQDLNGLIASLQSRPAFRHPVLHHHKVVEAHKAQRRHDTEGTVESSWAGIEFSLTVGYRRTA